MRILKTAGLLALGWVGLSAVMAMAQTPGGAFRPEFDYWVTGQWIYSNASPITYQPSYPRGFRTVLGFITPTANRTLALPDNSGGIPTTYWAGSNAGATSYAADANTSIRIIAGQATILGATGTTSIDTISPAFTSLNTFGCTANYATGNTGTNNIVVVKTSTSKITINGTSGGSNVPITWICIGY